MKKVRVLSTSQPLLAASVNRRLKWWLGGFGDEVQVISPLSLARAMHPHRIKEAA